MLLHILVAVYFQTHVTSAMLRFEAGRLLQFLGFEKIPEFPVKYISMAYTLSLDLPGELSRVINIENFFVNKLFCMA